MKTPGTTHTVVTITACQECKMPLDPPSRFHPYLHCLLFKAGIADPEHYILNSGYERR